MSKNFIMRIIITSIIIVFFCLPTSAQSEKDIKKEVPKVELHGALRFNYKLASWKENNKQRENRCPSCGSLVIKAIESKGIKT